jgi:Ulp1 family protease
LVGIQTSTRKSVSTKVDQHQNNKDEDDNENDLPSLFSLMADDEPKVSLPREDLTARALESMRKAELKKVSVSEDLEATDELKGPEESSEKIVLRYKSSCTYGASGITVTTADIALLMPDCWLNDNLINFYLMYLYDSVLTDEQKSQTYVFSTFLHQKLTEMGKKENRRSGLKNCFLSLVRWLFMVLFQV